MGSGNGQGNGRTRIQKKLKHSVLEDFRPRSEVDDEVTEPVAAGPPVSAPIPDEHEEAGARRSAADAYEPLGDFLGAFGADAVMISFAALENMLKRKLPASALERESWWTNKPRGRGHAQAWRDVGWTVQSVDIKKKRVNFARLPK